MAEKPILHLVKMTGDTKKDLQALAALYKALTGKDPTPEELEKARARR
jgi:hypothetical protein